MIYEIVYNVDKRSVVNGNLTSNIHWLFCITFNIKRFGPPKVHIGQTPEHCFKVH